MNSKRDLKKQIRLICGDLVGECLLMGEVCPEEKQGEVGQLVIDLAVLQESTIEKISFNFDKSVRDFATRHDYLKARSAYNRSAYATLREQFNTRLNEIVHRMNEVAGLAKGDE